MYAQIMKVSYLINARCEVRKVYVIALTTLTTPIKSIMPPQIKNKKVKALHWTRTMTK